MKLASGKASAIGYRDILLGMNLMLSVVLGLVLMSINPPAVSADDAKQPGQMVISAGWQEGPIDVDLWVKGPSDDLAVGYSNRGGKLFNLLRDDLGLDGDGLPLNYENVYSRGLPAGEYTVNLHLYSGQGPGPGGLEIRFGPVGDQTRLFLKKRVVLAAKGQEVTVVNFSLDAKGAVVPGSVNEVYRPLRVAKKP